VSFLENKGWYENRVATGRSLSIQSLLSVL
jgi:hypothetical protein